VDATLRAGIGASAFVVDFARIREWKPALDCAHWLSLSVNGAERVRVDISGPRRWVAFQKTVNGSALACIGHQETVGMVKRGETIISGSNRKTLAWLHPSGRVYIGETLRSLEDCTQED
jgi:hypothetical protein